jgi:dienelactone hydrolase
MTPSYPHKWEQRLAEWGYVSLQVDSLTPRGISGICGGGMITLELLPFRVADAYLARDYLTELDVVDPNRIGVMGWSHGGTTTIKTVNKSGEPRQERPFAAAVAFYPACYKPIDPIRPLLILSGGKDRWTPAEFCLRHAPAPNQTAAFKIEVYPEAYHCFDWVGIDTKQQGHILRYHAQSAEDAFARANAFFKDHLGGK